MKIDAKITINAPPHVVRETFLDFPNLLQWHDGSFWKQIELQTSNKNGLHSAVGDNVKCTMPGMTFKCQVVTNEAQHFAWGNSIPLMGSAKHHYYFTSVDGNPNQTVFIQHEDITGGVSLVMSMMGAEGNSKKGWKKVNEDLKAASEKRWAEEQAGTTA